MVMVKEGCTSCTNSSTLVLYASSPCGAAERGIARSIFSWAAAFMLLRRYVRSEDDWRSILRWCGSITKT